METDVLEAVREELVQSVDEKTRDGAQRFFKEEVKFHGVKSAEVKKIAQKYWRAIKRKEKQEIFALCENLLQSGFGGRDFYRLRMGLFTKERIRARRFSGI